MDRGRPDGLARQTLGFLARNRDAIVEVLCDVTTKASCMPGLLMLPSQHITQDGMKVMANASTSSFRAEQALQQCREQAALHLKATLARMEEPPLSERSRSARERHARQLQQRVEQASQVARELAAAREATRKPSEPARASRASTTDPEARMMKMAPHGGFAPAHNVQFTVGSGRGGPAAILGVQVTSRGNDRGSVWPMRDRVSAYVGVTPIRLVDSDHIDLDDLRRARREHLKVISTVPQTWRRSHYQDDTTRGRG
ncbi:MAG: hypothetical protein R3A52_24415 [Polyangiales bacterium]